MSSKNFELYFDSAANLFFFKSNRFNLADNLFAGDLKLLLFGLEHYLIKKLKFAGKSFRIEKRVLTTKINAIDVFNLKFGHSYPTFMFFNKARKKHLKKTKMFFLTVNPNDLSRNLQAMVSLRAWNLYTQRGIRLYKQVIVKKPGKKSTFS